MRQKRREKDDVSDGSGDELRDSYSEKSFRDLNTLNIKKDGVSTLRMMGTRIGRKSNVTQTAA